MTNFEAALATVERWRCPECRGRGKKDDGEPGDSYYHEWNCDTCRGTGILNASVITVTVEAGA